MLVYCFQYLRDRRIPRVPVRVAPGSPFAHFSAAVYLSFRKLYPKVKVDMEILQPIQTPRNVIERLPTPVVDRVAPPVVNAIQVPVVDVPVPRIDYPRIELPPQAPPAPSAPRSESQASEETEQPARQLPDTPKMPAVVVPTAVLQTPPAAEAQSEPIKDTFTMEIAGQDINIPTPQAVVQASATAVVGTSATLVTALIFNQARTAAAPVIQKLARDRFKVKLKSTKPVLHFVEEEGEVSVIEYSDKGVKVLSTRVQNPEQYLRDLIDADHLFETDHKIIIDEPVKERFTKEGAKRFNYFISAKKLAKKMSAKFTFG